MAFTEVDKLSIARILGTSPTLLNVHITSLGVTLTAGVEAAVIDELSRWDDGAGSKFVKIHPTESNFGVETNAGDTKADIRRNIAILLEWPYSVAATMGTLQIGY